MSILELCDVATMERNSQRADALGALLRAVLDAGDPDGRFQNSVRPMFQGFDQAVRRRKIEALARAFGIPRDKMKRYLRAAGIVNNMD